MDWFTGIVVYILVWWTVIFIVLPLGLQRDAQGLPVSLNLKMKALQTSVLALIVWIIIYILIQNDVIDFRVLAERMAHE
jgi:predicted secreted protein